MESSRSSRKAPVSSSAPAAGDSDLPQLRVIVGDDDRMIRNLLQLVLEKKGLYVTPACDGTEVLKRWTEGGYDAILMDVEMPEMNGLAAARAIREREREGRRIPIIGLTAHTAAEDRDRCLASGMNDCLAKPVDFSNLLATLRRWSTAP